MLRHALGIVVLTASLSALAADENPDAQFYAKATQGSLSEIDAGMLAQRQANSPAIKRFGEMMVKDHTAANQTLRGIANAKSVDLPTAPTSEQAAKRAGLQALSGDDFDRAYVEWEILEHKDTIAMFKEEARAGDDADAKKFAADTLPTLQSHLTALMAMPNVPVAKDAP